MSRSRSFLKKSFFPVPVFKMGSMTTNSGLFEAIKLPNLLAILMFGTKPILKYFSEKFFKRLLKDS